MAATQEEYHIKSARPMVRQFTNWKEMLYSFMARMCVEAKLNTRYTNHSVRATSITALDHAWIDSRHIMAISGHKSEQSMKSYSQNVSDTKKREMADVLSTNTTVLNPAKGANSTVSKVQTETLPPSDMGLTGHVSCISHTTQ